MQNFRRLLPSASGLIIFEAAGRHENFTRAARELGMTQAAVSYAIRALEEQFGVSLFNRNHRAVELTEAGARFHADVSAGLARIGKSAEDLRAKGRESNVTLAASSAFASMWMLPRLTRLRDELPDIDLRIQTSMRDFDIEEEDIALAIRGGEPSRWPRYHSTPLAREVISAVASPAYVAAHGPMTRPADLVGHRLIHLEEPIREALDWQQWFASAGIVYQQQSRPLVVNDYVLVIQAVQAGEGIALGWRHLISRMVTGGSLVEVGGHMVETGNHFHIVWPRSRELNAPARRVRDWLAAEGMAAKD